MSRQRGNAVAIQNSRGNHGIVFPFLLGTAVGGLAGAVVGTLLSGQAAQLFATLIDVVERRDGDSERPKFEFLLQ